MRHLLESGAVKFGRFKLKSGRISEYFINVAAAMKTGEDASLVADAYVRHILETGVDFDFVHGVAYKGIPIAALISSKLCEHGFNKRWGYDRKDMKAYGDTSEMRIVGDLRDGDRVLIVDDVITTGRTKVDVWRLLLSCRNVRPAGVLVAVDREEMSDEDRALLDEHGLNVFTILKISDFKREREKEHGF